MLVEEALAAGGGELVVFGAAVEVGDFPGGGDPAFGLEAFEGGVEGAEFDVERVAGSGAKGFGDAVSVEGAGAEGAQDEHVERAFEEVHMEGFYMKESDM